MERVAEMAELRPGTGRGERLAAMALLVAITIGSAVLWIGLPYACLWLSSKASESLAEHFLLALPMTIAAMLAWVIFLSWLNQLYLQVTGAIARAEEDAEAGWHRRLRGPLEVLLAWSFFIALVALFIWFFFFAENPSSQVL